MDPDENDINELDNYKEIKVLKKGGEGVVHEVEHKITNEKWAMKIIVIDNNQRNEYETLKNINHDDILKPIKMFIKKDKFQLSIYLIYQLMDMNLREYCQDYLLKKNESFSLENMYKLMQSLINVLIYLKNIKIAHRDIKPQNVLVKIDSNNVPSFYLIDFGGSKSVDQITQNNTLVGTLHYLSPLLMEAYQNNRFDQIHDVYKSDVFSLGLLFLECFTSKSINGYNTKPDEIKRLLKTVKEEYNENIKEMIEKMLEFNETKRISYEELLEYLPINFTIIVTSETKYQITISQSNTIQQLYNEINKEISIIYANENEYTLFYHRKAKNQVMKISWKDFKKSIFSYNFPIKCNLYLGPLINEKRYENIVSYFFDMKDIPLYEIHDKFQWIIQKSLEFGCDFPKENEICYSNECNCKITPRKLYIDNIDTIIIGFQASIASKGKYYIIIEGNNTKNYIKPLKFLNIYITSIIKELENSKCIEVIEDILRKKYDPIYILQIADEINAKKVYEIVEKAILQLWKSVKMTKYGFLNESYLFLYESCKKELIH